MDYNTKSLLKYGTANTPEEAVKMGIEFIRKHQYVFSIKSPKGDTLLYVDGFNNISSRTGAPSWSDVCDELKPWEWFEEYLCTFDEDTQEYYTDPDKVFEELGIELEPIM